MTYVYILFAIVGLIALGQWIYRRGWGMVPTAIALFVLTASAVGMLNSGQLDPLSALLATGGIILTGSSIVRARRFRRDWRPRVAAVAVSLVLLAILWWPQMSSMSMPSVISVPHAPPITSPVVTTPVTPVTPPSHTPTRSTHGPSAAECSGLGYDARRTLGCP